jgi:hypothetical protein
MPASSKTHVVIYRDAGASSAIVVFGPAPEADCLTFWTSRPTSVTHPDSDEVIGRYRVRLAKPGEKAETDAH